MSAFAAGVMHGLLGKEGAATAYTKKDKETAKKDVIQTAEEQEPKVAERRSSRRRRDEPEDTEMDVAETGMQHFAFVFIF